VAVSPQVEEFNRKFAREKGLSFRLLSDPGNRVARKFNLAFQLPEDLRRVYLGFGVDLEKFNGDRSWTLPIPARFVIDQCGIIRSADVNADYTKRPEPEDTLRVLRRLSEESSDMDFQSCIREAAARSGKADTGHQEWRI
jgi:peroxiredoxin